LAKKYGRIHRLLKILTLIQSERGWNVRRLASACGVAERTIFRDMQMLEGAGIPYFHDEEADGYRVRTDFFMPPIELTLVESLALIALSEQIGGKEQIPFMKAAARAIAKVKGQLPARIQEELADLNAHMDIQLAQASSEEGIQDVYDVVRQAIAKRRLMQCSYESLAAGKGDAGAQEVFHLKPYKLFFSQRAWYTIGHHSARGEVRCLRLSRFSRAQLTDIPYAIPDDFALDQHLGKAWRMIRGKRTYKVELHVDAEFAETIAETHWHDTQEILWQEDDSIIFRCQVDGLDEIVWWILSMGPHCVVRKPKVLIDRLKKLAGGIVDAYKPRARN
jgi:predicted DNA-binding transcriptional regulator YafY